MKTIAAVIAGLAIAVGVLLPSAAAPTPPDYLLIDRAALLALPTSGAAWTGVTTAAAANATADLCDQDNKADVTALANGLIYARTASADAAAKARSLIDAAMASQRDGCGNAVLALGRQLGGYVLAADLIGDHDSAFVSWLTQIRTRNIGGHGRWYILRDTSGNSANNWGLWATASLIAADAYLGDTAALDTDWAVFTGYGDGSWPFVKTGSWSQAWSCPQGSGSRLPIAIDPVGCTLGGGFDGDGVTVEDASRSAFPTASSYIHEAVAPLTISALLLAQAGWPAWTANDGQVCRAGAFAERVGRLNDWAGAYFASWVLDPACHLSLPKETPTSSGRLLGFTDWLYGAGSVPEPSSTPTSSSSPPPTATPTVVPTATATPQPSPSPTATPTASPTPTAMPDPVIEAIEASSLSPDDKALLEAIYQRLQR